MRDAIFEGKSYTDIDMAAQKALATANIYTFRYFHKDKVWMASDVTAKRFGIKKFYRVNGYSEAPRLVIEEDMEKDRAMYLRILAGAKITSEELRMLDGDQYYKVTLTVLEADENGEAEIIAGIIEDYDNTMMQNALVQMLASDYYSVFNVNFINNKITTYKLLNRLVGIYDKLIESNPDYEWVIGKYIEDLVIEEERAEMHLVTSREYLEKKLNEYSIFFHDFRILRDGNPTYIRIKFVKLNEGEELQRMVIGFADVSHEKNAIWERLAFFDSVTLGPNYNKYSEQLKSEGREGYIVSLDIRDFKLINNTCGISGGDRILYSISRIIEAAIGLDGYYGHVNADHFVMFLAYDNEEQVIAVMEQIKDKLAELTIKENSPRILPYFGATRWIPGGRIQVSFSEANTAKHRIKPTKNQYYGFYREEDVRAAIESKRIEDSFEKAIQNEEFEVWYQPKFDPEGKVLTGAEALVRWRTEDGSIVAPYKFIPVYENNGMIRELDEYVFEKVCILQKRLLSTYGCTTPISVNLSRVSLFDEKVIKCYERIAEKHNLQLGLMPLEITESAMVTNSEIFELAEEFNRAGFKLCVDDFGTGYSSLSTLNIMKFETLKLDKSLIDYIGVSGGEKLIKHTIALAKDLGLLVTAEGVEEDNQLEFLKSVGCDSIQGYIFSKPLPEKEFLAILDESMSNLNLQPEMTK